MYVLNGHPDAVTTAEHVIPILRKKQMINAFCGISGGGKLALYLLDLLLLRLLGAVPAVIAHLLIYIALHADGIVERALKCLFYIGRAGFDSTVHIQVNNAFRSQEDALHDVSVAHFLPSLYIVGFVDFLQLTKCVDLDNVAVQTGAYLNFVLPPIGLIRYSFPVALLSTGSKKSILDML